VFSTIINIHQAKLLLQPITSHQLNAWLLRHALGPPVRLLRQGKLSYAMPPFSFIFKFQLCGRSHIWNKMKLNKCRKNHLFYFYFVSDLPTALREAFSSCGRFGVRLMRQQTRVPTLARASLAASASAAIALCSWTGRRTSLLYTHRAAASRGNQWDDIGWQQSIDDAHGGLPIDTTARTPSHQHDAAADATALRRKYTTRRHDKPNRFLDHKPGKPGILRDFSVHGKLREFFYPIYFVATLTGF